MLGTFTGLGLGVVESRFDPNAVSKKGAVGVYQFMEVAAKEVGLKDRRKPVEAVEAAIEYTTRKYGEVKQKIISETKGDRSLLAKYTVGDVLALTYAAYNGGAAHIGPISIKNARTGADLVDVPNESKNYGTRVLGWSKTLRKGAWPENTGKNKSQSDMVKKLAELHGLDVNMLEELLSKKAF